MAQRLPMRVGGSPRAPVAATLRAATARLDDHLDWLTGPLLAAANALLVRIADQRGLTPGVHPGYRSLGTRTRS